MSRRTLEVGVGGHNDGYPVCTLVGGKKNAKMRLMSGPGDTTKTERLNKRVRYIKRHRVRRRSVNKGRNIALVVLASVITCAIFFAVWWSFTHQGNWIGTTETPWQERR